MHGLVAGAGAVGAASVLQEWAAAVELAVDTGAVRQAVASPLRTWACGKLFSAVGSQEPVLFSSGGAFCHPGVHTWSPCVT